MGDWFTPEGGRAAEPDSWFTARPAEPADDLWGILPVPATPQDEPPARGDERSARGGGHRGRLRLVRSPVAWAVLLAGLAVAVGGTIGLSRLAGRAGEAPRPLAKAAPAPHGVFAAPPPARARGPVSKPVALAIPAIAVRTPLVRLGRTPQGTLQVPASPSVAGWYLGSPRPGEIGSSIIVGHIDSYLGPGVFFRLRLLRPGDLVYVRRANGTLAVFRVYAERMYAKAHFPTQQVYGPEPDAELHLITCGGVFDSATGSYLSNVVVYAAEIRYHPAGRHHRQARQHHRARRDHHRAHLLAAHQPLTRHS